MLSLLRVPVCLALAPARTDREAPVPSVSFDPAPLHWLRPPVLCAKR